MNRSRLFCRLLYLKGLQLHPHSAYMAAIMTTGAAAGAVLGNEEEAVEAVQMAHAHCTSASHGDAFDAMHAACRQLHGGEGSCQVYFAHNPDDRITSKVAKRGVVPPFTEASANDKGLPKNSIAWKAAYNNRRLMNRNQANGITGFNLV